jgi:hypothetical protein
MAIVLKLFYYRGGPIVGAAIDTCDFIYVRMVGLFFSAPVADSYIGFC